MYNTYSISIIVIGTRVVGYILIGKLLPTEKYEISYLSCSYKSLNIFHFITVMNTSNTSSKSYFVKLRLINRWNTPFLDKYTRTVFFFCR